jgi:hypothetical protein
MMGLSAVKILYLEDTKFLSIYHCINKTIKSLTNCSFSQVKRISIFPIILSVWVMCIATFRITNISTLYTGFLLYTGELVYTVYLRSARTKYTQLVKPHSTCTWAGKNHWYKNEVVGISNCLGGTC